MLELNLFCKDIETGANNVIWQILRLYLEHKQGISQCLCTSHS